MYSQVWCQMLEHIPINPEEERYRQHVSEIYNHLAHLTGDECGLLCDLPLDKLFIKLTVVPPPSINFCYYPTPFQTRIRTGVQNTANLIEPELEAGVDEIEHLRWWQSKEDSLPIRLPKPISLKTALHKYRRLIIIGAPGSGKTTMLRWLANTLANRKPTLLNSRLRTDLTENTLPILLELRRFSEHLQALKETFTTFDLAAEISAFIAKDSRFDGVSKAWIHSRLKNQPCLLLLDGLDEITDISTRQYLVSVLETLLFSPTYIHLRCILTSRPHGFQHLRVNFQRTEIQPFCFNDVKLFIQYWYNTTYELHSQKEVPKLIEAIEANKRLKKLVQEPLWCTLIAMVYHHRHFLPRCRVTLLKECYQILLESWNCPTNMKVSRLSGELNGDAQLEFLMPIAYDFHQTGQLAVAEEKVVKSLAQTLEKLNLHHGLKAQPKAMRFIEVFGDRMALLQKRGDGTLEFIHRVFQEYLTARYIAVQDNYIDLVMEHLHEVWWRETHLLVISYLGSGVGNAKKAEHLLLTILNTDWESSQKWQRELAWYLMREFKLVAQGYDEVTNKTLTLSKAISDFAVNHVLEWIHKPTNSDQFSFLITTIAEDLADIAPNLLSHPLISILLKALLEKKEQRVRRIMVWSLGQLGQAFDSVIETLLVLLRDEDGWMRGAVAKSLGQLGQANEPVIKALLGALQDEDWFVRHFAAKSLGQLGQASDSVINALSDALQDDEWFVLSTAAKSLGQLGKANERVISGLLDLLRDTGEIPSIVAKSLIQLDQRNETVIKALLNACWDEYDEVECTVVKRLIQWAQTNEQIAKILLSVLRKNEDKLIQISVAKEILGRLDQEANDPVIKALVNVLRDKNKSVRNIAINTLDQLSQTTDQMIKIPLKNLREQDCNVRLTAIFSLTELDQTSEKVVKALLSALQDKNQNVRSEAASNLGQLGKAHEDVINALLGALRDEDETVRNAVGKSLIQLGKANQEVIEVLLAILRDKNEWRRRDATNSLGQLAQNQVNDQVIKALLDALQNEKIEWVRHDMVLCLGMAPASDAVINALLDILADKSAYMRHAAAISLSQLKIENETQWQSVLITITNQLHEDDYVAFKVAHQLLEGQRIPGLLQVRL